MGDPNLVRLQIYVDPEELRQVTLGQGIQRELIPSSSPRVVVDTSALIDGRLRDILEEGFLWSVFIVLDVVLRELRHIADSADPLKRAKGQRGLEVLETLKHHSGCSLEILETEGPEGREVDDELIRVAGSLNIPLLTTDANLQRIAHLRGVRALNINGLAHAVRTLFLPGEPLEITIMQPGREPKQGVGFLEDGTMVVVVNWEGRIGSSVAVLVDRILSTKSGKMIFAVPQGT